MRRTTRFATEFSLAVHWTQSNKVEVSQVLVHVNRVEVTAYYRDGNRIMLDLRLQDC